MSHYVYGTGISYLQYLQAKSFVDDISSTGRGISVEVSRRTLDVIASNEALARDNIRVLKGQHREYMAAIDASSDRISDGLDRLSHDVHVGVERISDALDTGFERLSLGLEAIESGLSELNATFDWGFSEMLAGIGHMSDLLSELIKIAKTPVQTVAFNHFEIARDAFRQRLYRECLEELNKAIFGDHTSPGYKLEWRFHQLVGTVRLGFAEMSSEDLQELQNLSQAEESFLLAARYAKVDYPKEAAVAFLSAGWAAYSQGKMRDALRHTEQALASDSRLGEAFFQAAKVRVALGEVDAALPVLRRAIDLDRGYALKAAADGDFQKYDERLRLFLEALRHEKLQQALDRVRTILNTVDKTLEELELSPQSSNVEALREFVATGQHLPLVDLIDAVPKLDPSIAVIEGKLAPLREATQRARASLAALRFWRENAANAAGSAHLHRLELFAPGSTQPLPVVLAAIQSLPASLAALEAEARNSTILLTQPIGQISYQQQFEAEESYQEEVVIRPGGFFRKPVAEVQTKVRTVRKTRTVTLTQIRDDIRRLWGASGEPLVSVDFCEIPPGRFQMGAQGDQHGVILTTGYFMGKYPITQAQWQAVMGTNSSRFKGDRRPVECGSWLDCQTLITRLNELVGKDLYRLPTEAEWEYACRAGSEAKYYWGNSDIEFSRYAWCAGNSEDRRTQPVGLLEPNPWGLHDMIGNVWEWCQDIYDYYPRATVTDPCVKTGWLHVYRGGSISDPVCPVATRDQGGPRIVGLRLARRIL